MGAGEKVYCIREGCQNDQLEYMVGESELIHRIERIRHEDRPMEGYIRILLTGEAKECACVYENGKLVAPCAYHQDK
jgi:hypothetical protein